MNGFWQLALVKYDYIAVINRHYAIILIPTADPCDRQD